MRSAMHGYTCLGLHYHEGSYILYLQGVHKYKSVRTTSCLHHSAQMLLPCFMLFTILCLTGKLIGDSMVCAQLLLSLWKCGICLVFQ